MFQKLIRFFKKEQVKEILLSALVALVGVVAKMQPEENQLDHNVQEF